MKRTLLRTGDGSYTLQIPEWDEQYHSKHGAIAEALHVFIKEGLQHLVSVHSIAEISIMEIGFGTGLNCALTYLEAEKIDLKINYTAIEGYPLSIQEALSLEYQHILTQLYPTRNSEIKIEELLFELHQTPWEKLNDIFNNFQLQKQQKFFSEISDENRFNLIYFDAFGIRVQPELWTEQIFQKMYTALKPDGVLVTYAANGNARRAMQSVGFSVQRLQGPPGKKEMLRATRA